jgi:Ca-activated chloride channel family protein
VDLGMPIDIAWPWAFAALPLPLLVARLVPPAGDDATAMLRLPFTAPRPTAAGQFAAQRSQLRLWASVLAWCLLVTAAARPQAPGEPISTQVSGRSLMLAVDISASMASRDSRSIDGGARTRLTTVKELAGEFIERRDGDRIGLILFADRAYLQAPLTFDRQTVRTFLDEAVVGLAGRNTAIGDAIGLAVKRLSATPEGDRVLILLTDGANTAGSIAPEKAAELADWSGIRVHTIGIGSSRSGGPWSIRPSSATDLDETTLQGIAQQTGGRYFRADSARALQQVYAVIDGLEPSIVEELRFVPIEELYAWPLAGAWLISLAIALNMLRRTSRVGRDGDLGA